MSPILSISPQHHINTTLWLLFTSRSSIGWCWEDWRRCWGDWGWCWADLRRDWGDLGRCWGDRGSMGGHTNQMGAMYRWWDFYIGLSVCVWEERVWTGPQAKLNMGLDNKLHTGQNSNQKRFHCWLLIIIHDVCMHTCSCKPWRIAYINSYLYARLAANNCFN